MMCLCASAWAGNSGPKGKKNDSKDAPPMFLLGTNQGLPQMVYWTDLAEPQRDPEYPEYYEDSHKEWEFQEMFRRNASKYTRLIGEDQIRSVKYVDEVLLSPDGDELFPGELHGRNDIPSPGARYAIQGKLYEDDLPGTVVVTDDYLANHKLMTVEAISWEDEYPTMPAAVIKKMEDKYGMKAERSIKAYTIGNRYTYGIIQFAGEYVAGTKNKKYDGKSALALEIITDGDKVYSYPVEGWYDPEYGPTWNADDGGEYLTSYIAAAFDGPQGPEICYVHWAPESATTGMFTIQGNELVRQQYAVYHSLIDEESPIWKKDIAEMKRLYYEEDPNEHEDVELTKWTHVYIDYEGEQIWISDEDEQNGAFFNREDGKWKLITTVRAGLQPSFPESKDGANYLMLSGHSGGPSYYYEIFTLKGGKVAETFTAIYTYGEPYSCALNGEEISNDQGEAYLEAIPEPIERYIFWQEIKP